MRWYLPIVYAAVWLTLAGPAPESLVIGLPCVIAATWLHERLAGAESATRAVKLRALPAFALYFVRESVRSAWDIARRTLRPRVDIDPGVLDYHCTSTSTATIGLLIAVMNLLPGTLVVSAEGQRLVIHVVDRNAATAEALAALERRVARLFLPQRPAP